MVPGIPPICNLLLPKALKEEVGDDKADVTLCEELAGVGFANLDEDLFSSFCCRWPS